jgi:L-fuconolactonase
LWSSPPPNTSTTTSGIWRSRATIPSWSESRATSIQARTTSAKYLNHFHRDPLFRAIRSSRFYTKDASGKVALNPTQVANLKLLAQADLALDTANPSMDLMNANVLLADAVPDLRIIMDHLPSFDPTPDNQAAYEAVIKEMAARPNIFVKLTEVYHPAPGRQRHHREEL